LRRRRAFVNCTRDMLLKDYVTLLPSQQTVVEILESVEVDDLVIAACHRLKESGYMIALDDFLPVDPREKLADLADVIKVDVRRTTEKQRLAIVKRFGPWRSRMLAEKVETRKEFEAVRKEGFFYFQGYFFRRPELMTTHEVPANRLNYIRMLQAVSKPELDSREVENVIKSEVSICYRLLRYLNSAAFGFNKQIHSVKHALSLRLCFSAALAGNLSVASCWRLNPGSGKTRLNSPKPCTSAKVKSPKLIGRRCSGHGK
jgi:c-di-GMP-related signal transduction protein